MGCAQQQMAKPRTAKNIDAMLKEEKSKQIGTKVLLLGTGGAGKTTFLNQLLFSTKIGSVKDDKKLQMRSLDIMHENILRGMRSMAAKAIENDTLPKTQDIQSAVALLANSVDIQKDEIEAVKLLWNQTGIKDVWNRKLVSLPTCLDYFLNDMDRITEADFLMTEDDILRLRQRTTGIQWREIPQGGKMAGWTFIDVGGQQSERRKWVHVFENVTAVIYVSPLDSYNLISEDDGVTNRLDDDVKLFSQLVACPFLPTFWIFFQNKSDLFAQKILSHPLSETFPEIEKSKSTDYSHGVEFIRKKFSDKIPKGSKAVFHVTCALDRGKFKQIMTDVESYILQIGLSKNGLHF